MSKEKKYSTGREEKYTCISIFKVKKMVNIIWASLRQNLSSEFPTKRDSNKSPQLQRLAIKLEFFL